MAEEVKRDKDGKFLPGSVANPNGRPVGSLNRYTEIKNLICDTLLKRKDELDKVNMKDIIKFVSATAPKETKVDIQAPIIVRWDTDDSNDGAAAEPAASSGEDSV